MSGEGLSQARSTLAKVLDISAEFIPSTVVLPATKVAIKCIFTGQRWIVFLIIIGSTKLRHPNWEG